MGTRSGSELPDWFDIKIGSRPAGEVRRYFVGMSGRLWTSPTWASPLLGLHELLVDFPFHMCQLSPILEALLDGLQQEQAVGLVEVVLLCNLAGVASMPQQMRDGVLGDAGGLKSL